MTKGDKTKILNTLLRNVEDFKITVWEHTGSNRGPSRCKRDALNQLSYAPFFPFKECKNKG